MPRVVIIAGPNGAGKSTLAPELLKGPLTVHTFVNADTIALGLSGLAPANAAFEAGRVMLQRLKTLSKERKTFAFETTLASRSFGFWISELKKHGYFFDLVFLYLPTSEVAIKRVRERAQHGGHTVPTDVIKRRYFGGLKNFFSLYRPLANSWWFYDNAQTSPLLVSWGVGQREDHIADIDLWTKIKLKAHYNG